MKTSIARHLALTTALLVIGVSKSIAEGYFVFAGSLSNSGGAGAWENFSNGTFQRAPGTVNVAFYWGAANTTPAVDSVLVFTPTNSVSDIGGASWNYVLNDPNFVEAINANTSQPAIATVNASGVNQGGFSYNGGFSFPVFGTTGGNIYTLYMIGWSSAYATPQAAAAAGSPLGWSKPFQYESGTSTASAVATFNLSGAQAFGVTVPEPSTIALTSLAAAFVIRRRKTAV